MNKEETTSTNGKGSAPRNNLSQAFRDNYQSIEWKADTKTPKRKRRRSGTVPNRRPSNVSLA